MVWNKIRKFFGGGQEEGGSASSSGPEIPWIPADKNPWKTPILDVRPLTTTLLSVSTDPTCASNAISFGRDDGLGFVDQKPMLDRSIQVSLSFRRDRLLADGALFLPREMEHKWAIYFHAGKMLFIRSWLRKVLVVADTTQEGDKIDVVRITGSFQGDKEEESDFAARTLKYLIWSHAIGLPWPAPLPAGLEKDPRSAAMWCFSAFGNMAHFATHQTPDEGDLRPPLRSHSLMHIAVARADQGVVEAQLRAGVPVDLLAADGLPPLSWALATEGTSMLEFLVSKGSPVDVRSSQGATTLMNAAQDGGPEHMKWLLSHGAEVNARDTRGFTALHRAAEMGAEPLVELLLAHGANPKIEAQGHTAMSLAEARGHKAIVQRLRTK